MMEGYHLLNRGHALQMLEKPVHVPIDNLAVDHGERLDSQAMKVEYVHKQVHVVVPTPGTAAAENATIDGYGNPIAPEDFPQEFYLGNVVGGWDDGGI